MDVGTAKLTAAERGGVPHHLLDVWDVRRTATAADYQAACRAVVDDLLARGVTPVLVGGSGLYLRAALDDLEFPGTDAGPARRARGRPRARRGARPARPPARARPGGRDPHGADERPARRPGPRGRAADRLDARRADVVRRATTPTCYLGVDRADLAERIAPAGGPDVGAGPGRRGARRWRPQGLREGVTASRALGYAQVLALLDGRLSRGAGARAHGDRHPAVRPPPAGVVPARPAHPLAPERRATCWPARSRSCVAAAARVAAEEPSTPSGVKGGGVYMVAGRPRALAFAPMCTTSHPARTRAPSRRR